MLQTKKWQKVAIQNTNIIKKIQKLTEIIFFLDCEVPPTNAPLRQAQQHNSSVLDAKKSNDSQYAPNQPIFSLPASNKFPARTLQYSDTNSKTSYQFQNRRHKPDQIEST
eukprot:TRINITY_DN8041_c0_g1_i4.p2 TRINITY_DN8041_c0_g1~~TRINITY_DN8041_c0_g1_i4.p2  ORF type:complete len:110 (-),score=2.56 TRINITY_DN8041_c0_g1_i4:74-403(-)